jgi:DNA-binding SARP family transcriptional activator/tetratricopeptide (TPR) repeat protein/TolB-like protein
MLRLLTLGGLSLVDDGAQVTGAASQRSRLALLAILAVAGPAGIAREKVLACLWPESDDERARHALKQAVYALRRDLGSEHAIQGTATLCLDPTLVASDVRDFDDAIARGDDAAAVALYAGPFLDGVFVRGSAEFDQWAATERARLERAHHDAIGRLARAAEAAGDTVASVGWWRRAAAAEPLSGRVALSLMRALAEAGDVTEAIQHARIHDAVVQGQLDTPADEAVLAFAEELRRGDWTPPARVTPPRVSAPSVEAEATTPMTPLVTSTPPIPTETRVPTSSPPGRWRRWSKPLAIAAGAMVILAMALMPSMRAKWGLASSAPPATVSARRIVVGPFRNNTRDKTLDPIGEIAADWLVRSLLDAEFDVVDSRNSSPFAYRAARDTAAPLVDPVVLAAQKGAATVITGSYYQQGDTLTFSASLIDPVRGVPLHSVKPAMGPRSEQSKLLGDLASRVAVAMVNSVDSAVGARTAFVGDPPSIEAYEHASRGWEMFFARPDDTTAVFTELRQAAEIDTSYFVPRLMRAYVLDVKEAWPLLDEAVKELKPRRGRMSRVERESLALFEADLRGDLQGRLRASRELMKLSPGNVDMALLVAVSASYLNMSQLAYDALNGSDPNFGINAVSPMYWSWHAVAEHTMGRYDDEVKSATILARRFPAQRYGALALVRAHAARGDTLALRKVLEASGGYAQSPTLEARGLILEAGRELRAHGYARAADSIFAIAATQRPRPGATTEERARYGQAVYEAGDLVRAREVFGSLLAASPRNVDFLGRLGTIAVRTGDSTTARQVEQRLMEWKEPYPLGRPQYWRAHLAALSGRGTEAVELLHSAVNAGMRSMDLQIVTLHEDRDFQPLWNDPGFKELVRARTGPAVIP